MSFGAANSITPQRDPVHQEKYSAGRQTSPQWFYRLELGREGAIHLGRVFTHSTWCALVEGGEPPPFSPESAASAAPSHLRPRASSMGQRSGRQTSTAPLPAGLVYCESSGSTKTANFMPFREGNRGNYRTYCRRARETAFHSAVVQKPEGQYTMRTLLLMCRHEKDPPVPRTISSSEPTACTVNTIYGGLVHSYSV